MKNFNVRQIQRAKKLDHLLKILLFPWWKKKQKRAVLLHPKSILIFDFHLIGDIVMLTPLLLEMRKHNPHAHIALVAGKWAETILENHPQLYDEFYPINAPWVKYDYSIQNLRSLVNLVWNLRKRKWDWGIEVRGDLRQIVILFLTGVSRRIGYDFTGGRYLLTDVVPDNGRIKHILTHHLQIILYLYPKIPEKSFIPQLWISEKEQQELGNSPKFVGLHLGASMPLRMLPLCKAQELLLHLLSTNNLPVLIFQTHEMANYISMLCSIIPKTEQKRVSIESYSLRQFIAKVAQCSFFIGLDSAGGHIASSFGVPVYSIFGPADPEFCKPIGTNVEIIALPNEQVSCRPCDQRNCTHEEYQYCLEQIDIKKI